MTAPVADWGSPPPPGAGRPAPSEEATEWMRGPRGKRGTPADGASTAITRNYPFLLPPVEPDEIGRLGNYRVLDLLGKGGMAYVFLAEDAGLRRRVALKIMKPELEGDGDAGQRFAREARLMAAVKHEHLVTVFQVGQESGVVYLAMELLRGETLEGRAARLGPAPAKDLPRLGREIAAGLAEMHRHGLVHRDIKPSNLWLEAPGEHVKVLDFGLARFIDDDAGFTREGVIVGTPGFMAPEQARGDKVDARSDLFSLGAVLYGLATGARPFPGKNTMAVLTALAVSDPCPARELNPNLPPALSELIDRLLAKAPEDRPASAEDVIDQLRQIEADLGDPTARRRPLPPTQVLLPPDERASASGNTLFARRRLVEAAAAVVLIVGGSLLVPALTETPKTYLSDLVPVDTKGWIKQPPAPLVLDPGKPRTPKAYGGVRVGGKPSPRGLFMHPPQKRDGGTARLDFRLHGQYAAFEAEVSLNDGPPLSVTPLTFSVQGDGRVLWQSREVRTGKDTQTCHVAVRGVNVLTLEVDCPGPSRGAHAVWIEPRLTK